jgi:hypothetical protein
MEDVDSIADRSLSEDRNDPKVAVIEHPHDVGAEDGAGASGGRSDDRHRIGVHHLAIGHRPRFVRAWYTGRRCRPQDCCKHDQTQDRNDKQAQVRIHAENPPSTGMAIGPMTRASRDEHDRK